VTFLAPGWLAGAGLLALSVIALHLLARRRPRPLVFPTARFIPDRPRTAAALARRPTDLPLLLYRLLLVLLLGFALSRPVLAPPRKTPSIVLLDQSRIAPPPDSAARAILASADRVIGFDSGQARGSLSGALVTALRASADLAESGDSVSLSIISPFVADEFDAATLRIRRQWAGRISLVRVTAARSAAATDTVVLPAGDPLTAAVSQLSRDGVLPARLVRDEATASDSSFARRGGALVLWPGTLPHSGWPRGPGDTIGGVVAGGYAVAAVFFREANPPPGTIVATWADGKPAATEAPLGAGCIRHVAIAVPETGDIVLRRSFLGLTRALLAPCGGWTDTAAVAPQLLDSLRGPPSLRPSTAASGLPQPRVPANRWMLLAAAVLFGLEPLVRRRTSVR
jgi:hypothetical protein